MKEHMARANGDVMLAVMVEDMTAVAQLAEIASLPGIDLIAVGPNDLAASMGITEPTDPELKRTIDHIAETLKRVGKAKMTFPLASHAYPLSAKELQQMGVVYANCGPTVVDLLLGPLTRQVAEIEAELDTIHSTREGAA
jgi:2-keto-3-deoxy-L-rhamnonate aldolase RhmA